MGASKAYHESQSRIYKLEAPLFVGVGEGTDNMDFLADLSALKVIEPEEVTKARPDISKPVPRSESELLQKLKQGEVPYMLIVHGVRKPCQPEVCWSNITTPFIMLCSNHLAVHSRLCSRRSWEKSCSYDNKTLAVSPHNISFFVRA